MSDTGMTSAAAKVEAVCRLLTSPTWSAVDECARLLESAGKAIQEGRESREFGLPEAESEVLRLKSMLHLARKLLNSAERFHSEWERSWGAMTGGYGESGTPASALRDGESRFSFQG